MTGDAYTTGNVILVGVLYCTTVWTPWGDSNIHHDYFGSSQVTTQELSDIDHAESRDHLLKLS